MPLIKQTSTGDNFIEKIHTDGDGSALTSMQFYDKQAGSDGASSNTVFTLPDNYTPGSHTLMVFVNGQKVEQVASSSNTSEYEETDYTTVTFGASLQDSDVVEFIVVGSYLTDSDSSGNVGDNLDFSLLNNGYLTIANSVDKPAGIEPVQGITDYRGVAFGDSGNDWIRLNHVSDTSIAYGFAAIPIDDKETYEVTIRHRCNATGTTGLYLRFNELNSALPIEKTHIGSNGGSKVANRTSLKDIYSNGAFPGAVWQENTYTYTPTAGTKYASFGMYNDDAVAKQYDVDSVQMRSISGVIEGATIGTDLKDSAGAIPIQNNILNTDANYNVFDKDPHPHGSNTTNKIDFKISNSQAVTGWYELCRYKCYVNYDSISVSGVLESGSHVQGYSYQCNVQINIRSSNPYSAASTRFMSMSSGENQSTFQDQFRMYYYQDTDSRWVVKIYLKLAAYRGMAGSFSVTSYSDDPSSSGFSWWYTHQDNSDSLGSSYSPAGIQQIPTFDYSSDTNSISFISKSGFNSQFIIVNNKLFSTSGNSGSHGNYTTGRGTDNTNPFYGIDNFKIINFPTESGNLVSAGGGYQNFAYVLFDSGNLYTWGLNSAGQCGLGHTSVVPVPVLSATSVSEVFDHPSNCTYSVNHTQLFIKKTNNKIYGCGYNASYQLGDGTTTQRTSWTEITGFGTTVSKLFNLGATYGCTVALTTDGKILVNGWNGRGNLGNASTVNIQTPTDVTNAWAGVASGVTDLKVSGAFGSYATSATSYVSIIMLITPPSGTKIVKSCGHNAYGQLGNGNNTQQTTPVAVLNSTNTVDISGISGILTGVMLKSNGDVYTWGYNAHGTIGNGTTTNNNTPASNITGCDKLFCDGMTSHAYGHQAQNFVRKTNGELWACGLNGDGYLGLGNITTPITSFTRVLMPYRSEEYITDLGHYSTNNANRTLIAITNKNNIYAWGYNQHFSLIEGTSINGRTPVQMPVPIIN